MPKLIISADLDNAPNTSQREAAAKLLAADLPADASTQLHSEIALEYKPQFSALVQSSHDLIAASEKPRGDGGGVDLGRYEEPSAPSTQSDAAAWQDAMRAAHISHAYLSERQLNLSLLERYGKNTWLIGNSQVEDLLRSANNELASIRAQIEQLKEERRLKQEAQRGEFEGLEETWRSTISRCIEAEIASEVLRRELLEEKRKVTT